MSANLIPKEKQTAYQRWEMASFGEERPVKKEKERELPQITPEELAAIREAARLQGYAEGLEQGRAAGTEAGYVAGLEQGKNDAANEIGYLQQVAEAFGNEVAHANEVIAQDMLNLTLDLAKAMLKTALQVKPELVLPIVSEAVRYLPVLQQPAVLFLNPADAQLIQRAMDAELTKSGWRVAEDVYMERGGCRIETGSNQIDATMPVRWQRIAAALGKDSNWMDA
jgi:flagellar assembly protein FliH